MICVRNLDPRRVAYLPVAPGWCRLVPPQSAATVPAQTVALPAVQRLLVAQRLRVITEISATPDAAEVLRRDLAAAIADLERRDFAALIARQVRQQGNAAEPVRRAYTHRQRPQDRKHRVDEWPAEQVERLRQRWIEGATRREIATELGVSRGAIDAKVNRLGLTGRQACRVVMAPRPANTRQARY